MGLSSTRSGLTISFDASLGQLFDVSIISPSNGQVLTYQNGIWVNSTAAGGSPGGLTTQFQYNNAGSFAGAAGLTYSSTGTNVTVIAQNANDIPLAVKANASGTGDIQQWYDATNTKTIYINSDSQIVGKSGGASGSPNFTFSGQLTSGMIYNVGVAFTVGGTIRVRFSTADKIIIRSTGAFGISAGAATANADVALGRTSAGVAQITDGLTGMGSLEVLDEVYGVTWDGSLQVATKNAIYDKIQTINTSCVTKSINQASHGFSVGNIIRLNGSGTYTKAQADSAVNAEVIGMVSTVTDVNNFILTTSGYVSGLSGLTANTIYFLDASTSGSITATAPTVVGQVNIPVFKADTTTSGYVSILRGELLTSPIVSVTGTTTLVSGVIAVTISGVTSSNNVLINLTVPGGTMGARVKAVCTTNTLTITATNTSGATSTGDTSTYFYQII